MNTAEELALIDLAEAVTPRMRLVALTRFASSRGIRLTEGTKARVVAAERLARTEPQQAMQMLPTMADRNESLVRLEPGPEPILEPSARAMIDEWVSCWERADILQTAGATLPGPLLLEGLPGTGKTMTTAWLAERLAHRFLSFVLDSHRWVRSYLGESSKQLSQAFGALGINSLLAIEELDGVGAKRGSDDAQGQEMTRITIALMRLMEQSRFPIVATTNRANALDPALLRRFEFIVSFPEPTLDHRANIAARELGAPVDGLRDQMKGLDVVAMVRVAMRARRLAVLNDREPAVVFAELLVRAEAHS